MKILVISLAGIGDTLLATPLLHELRLNFPDAQIDVLVKELGARDLLEANPHITSVHYEDMLNQSKWTTLRALRRFREQRYDVSINTYPQSKIHYRLVTRWIGAQERLSHIYDRWNFLDGLLVTKTIPQDYALHSIDNNLKFLELLGVQPKLQTHDSEIFLSSAEQQWANEALRDLGLAGKRVLGVHVGSGKTKNLALRRWPLENYIELFRELRKESDLAVVLFGGPEEKADHDRVLRELGDKSVLVAPSRSLRQAAALVGRCRGFLSVDTALMHVAAAMKVPRQIVIETPTFNKTIEPHARPYTLIPNPAVKGRNLEFYRYDGRDIQGTPEELRRCMLSVKVEDVLAAARAI
ncbi:MAG: glycosyltransferase family 9 protein [Verrucomicrobia subdivision 3 bacterium]|nr:glycosyltransferase family 9 protein [Limisphaerales bacterium]